MKHVEEFGDPDCTARQSPPAGPALEPVIVTAGKVQIGRMSALWPERCVLQMKMSLLFLQAPALHSVRFSALKL